MTGNEQNWNNAGRNAGPYGAHYPSGGATPAEDLAYRLGREEAQRKAQAEQQAAWQRSQQPYAKPSYGPSATSSNSGSAGASTSTRYYGAATPASSSSFAPIHFALMRQAERTTSHGIGRFLKNCFKIVAVVAVAVIGLGWMLDTSKRSPSIDPADQNGTDIPPRTVPHVQEKPSPLPSETPAPPARVETSDSTPFPTNNQPTAPSDEPVGNDFTPNPNETALPTTAPVSMAALLSVPGAEVRIPGARHQVAGSDHHGELVFTKANFRFEGFGDGPLVFERSNVDKVDKNGVKLIKKVKGSGKYRGEYHFAVRGKSDDGCSQPV